MHSVTSSESGFISETNSMDSSASFDQLTLEEEKSSLSSEPDQEELNPANRQVWIRRTRAQRIEEVEECFLPGTSVRRNQSLCERHRAIRRHARLLVKTIRESWDADEEARLTSSTMRERFLELAKELNFVEVGLPAD